jgi:hypothetical protein
MKKVMIFFLVSVFFIVGCTDYNRPAPTYFCKEVTDCQNKVPLIDCVGEWNCVQGQCVFECDTGKEKPYLELQAEPMSGIAPLTVTLQADLFDVEGHEEEYYCTSMTWDLGNGEKLAAIPGCIPYEEASKQDDFMQLDYLQKYTYKKPGTYVVSFTLGNLQSDKILLTVLDKKKLQCKEDSDCVPAECCHPRSFVNKKYGPNCGEIACTMNCEGPIDCGAGFPVCQEGMCVIAVNIV